MLQVSKFADLRLGIVPIETRRICFTCFSTGCSPQRRGAVRGSAEPHRTEVGVRKRSRAGGTLLPYGLCGHPPESDGLAEAPANGFLAVESRIPADDDYFAFRCGFRSNS